jgi:steroid delta-isomerase-like uncharacterized protein
VIAIAECWIVAGWQRGDPEAILRLYAPDFVDLGHSSGRPGTGEEQVAEIRARYAAVPDFFTTIAELIVDTEASAVAIRWTATGTHRWPFLGGAATGRRITFAGIETLRLHDDLLVEPHRGMEHP